AGADELPGRDATRPPGCRDGAAADRRQATAAHRGRLRQPMCEPGAQGGVDAAHPPGRLPHSAAHGRSGGRGGQGDHLFRDPHPAAVRGTPSGPDEVVADRSATATPVGLCHLAEHSGKLTCPRERGGHAYSERGTVVHRRAEGGLTMSEPGTQPATHAFLAHRNLLFTVAYEILGSAADAEDVLQETWLRWSEVDLSTIEQPRAYLVRITTRLALNRLRTLSRRKETYAASWPPEPVLTTPDVAEDVELAESVSMALMLVLETLSATERVVFVLHEVFGVPLTEIAQALEKSPAAVRQTARRARAHVQARRTRQVSSPDQARAVVERFNEALLTGDLDSLVDVLAPDVVYVADGGGV